MSGKKIKSEWQKYSQGVHQSAKGLNAENATFESLGKSSKGNRYALMRSIFLGVIVTTFKLMRCVYPLRTTATWFVLIDLLLMDWTELWQS